MDPRRLQLQPEVLIEQASRLTLLDEWTKGNAPAGEMAVPAVAIPLERKQAYECPQEHVDHLAKVLPRVERIISVGWRATDEPFIGLMREHAKSVRQVVCVTGSNPEDPLQRIVAVLDRVDDAQAIRGGFSNFITRRELKRLFG
jgi:hypothetical protein